MATEAEAKIEDGGPVLVLQARTPGIAELVEQCARGVLPFSGPDSLYTKVAAMGFNTNSLYYAVRAAKDAIEAEGEAL